MTTTLTTIHDRITCVLADVAPAIITEQLAQLVWELDETDRAIASSLADLDDHIKRMRQVLDAGQSLDFNVRLLVSKQQAVAELVADRGTDVQLIMQLVALVHRMTGTNPAVLRAAVFGGAS